MSEHIGGAYDGKRKEGMPIPDFASEEFFEALPELRSLRRDQLETIIGVAAHIFLIMNMPNPAGAKLSVNLISTLVMSASRIYGAKMGMDRANSTRLITQVIVWLKERTWTFCNFHHESGRGDTFLTTMPLKHIVMGDQN